MTPTSPRPRVVADATAAATLAAERTAASAHRGGRPRAAARDWATTGGSTPIGIYRRPRCARRSMARRRLGRPSTSGGATTGSCQRDHPLSNVKPLDDILLASADRGGHGRRRGRGPAPGGTCIRSDRRGDRPGRGRRTGAPRSSRTSCARSGPTCRRRLAVVRPGDAGDGWRRPRAVRVPGLGRVRRRRSWPGHPRPDPHRAARRAGHDAPGGHRCRAGEMLVVATGAGKAAMLAEVFGAERDPSRWPAQLARHDRATWILDDAAAGQLPR